MPKGDSNLKAVSVPLPSSSTPASTSSTTPAPSPIRHRPLRASPRRQRHRHHTTALILARAASDTPSRTPKPRECTAKPSSPSAAKSASTSSARSRSPTERASNQIRIDPRRPRHQVHPQLRLRTRRTIWHRREPLLDTGQAREGHDRIPRRKRHLPQRQTTTERHRLLTTNTTKHPSEGIIRTRRAGRRCSGSLRSAG